MGTRHPHFPAPLAALTLVVALGLFGCKSGAGSGVNPLPPAGTQTVVKTVALTDAGGTLDGGGGVSVTIPAGALQTGSSVKLIEWSGQRAVAQIPTCTQTAAAVDLVVAPAQFIGAGQLTVNLPWQAGGEPLGTTFTAFGPAGTPLVLTQTAASTQASPQATLGAAEIAFLAGVDVTSTAPVEIELAIEQLPLVAVDPAETSQSAKMRLVWSAPAESSKAHAHTNYANKKRVAVTVHGVMNTAADVQALTDFLSSKTATDGAATESSYPFDLVYAYEYDWTDLVETNGALLASAINSMWGDPAKYEVHVFGHSMGGIVSRWAVEQAGAPSVTELVTLGSPSKGVPIEAMRQWWLGLLAVPVAVGGLVANVLAPGPKELCEGSALLAKLSTSTVPAGVTFQAIGGTNPNLPTAYHSIAIATVLILQKQNRLPCDGFVPLDSALGNLATAKLSVPYNHSDLCDQAASYWPGSTAAAWIDGINRKIASLTLPYLKVVLNPQGTQTIAVVANDKDGAELDAGLLFDATLLNGANPALQWTAADPTIVSFSGQDKLSVTLTGLLAGSTTVTVKDPASGMTSDVLVQVGPGNVLIAPARPSVPEGTHATFTAALVTGAVPAGTSVTWTLSGNGTINGAQTVTSTSLTVDYLAPATPETDYLAVELKDGNGNSLGVISTPILVVFTSSISPDLPDLALSAQQTFAVLAGPGYTLPADATYQWTLTGAGALAGGSPVTTNSPSVSYTAPAEQGIDLLAVKVIAADGTVASTASTSINAGAQPSLHWTYTVTPALPAGPGQLSNGSYNDPLDGPVTIAPQPGSLDLLYFSYTVVEVGTLPDGSVLGVSFYLFVTAGAPFTAGQTFQYESGNGVSTAGTFAFDAVSTGAGTGTLTIGTVTPQSDGTTLVTFTFSCAAFGRTNASGSGSFTVTKT